MNPTFLLLAVQRVISRVEIRYKHTLIAAQKLPHDRSLPCFGKSEDNVVAVSEYPDVMIDASDVQPRFVGVNKRTFSQTLQENRLCTAVVLGEGLNEIDDARLGRRLMEQLLHCLGDHPVWKPKNNPLINRPSPKAVPKRLAAKPFDSGRFIVPLAPWTVPFFACVLNHRLPAPGICEVKINDGCFSIFPRLLLKSLSLVLGAASL